jgi:hypothetical protein
MRPTACAPAGTRRDKPSAATSGRGSTHNLTTRTVRCDLESSEQRSRLAAGGNVHLTNRSCVRFRRRLDSQSLTTSQLAAIFGGGSPHWTISATGSARKMIAKKPTPREFLRRDDPALPEPGQSRHRVAQCAADGVMRPMRFPEFGAPKKLQID